MRIKGLVNRYIFLSVLLIVFLIIVFRTIENNKKEAFFKENYKKIDKIYQKYLNIQKEYDQIFFFNFITKDKNLLNLLKDENPNKTKLKQLLQNSSSFYKNYNIQQINLYSATLEPFSNTLDLDLNHKKILEEIKNSNEEFLEILVSNKQASLNFIKTIYDEKYNLLGVFEAVSNLPKIAHKIYLNEEVSVNFIFKKEVLSKELLKNYKAFDLNKQYFYENSFYNNRETIETNNFDFKDIQTKLEKNKNFSILFVKDETTFVKSFIPFFDFLNNKPIGFVVFTKEANSYSQELAKYNLIAFFCLLILFSIILFFNLYNKKKSDYLISQAKLENLTKAIDKYVIIVETDLKGIVTYASQAFCDVSGYKKEEILKKPMNLVRSPDISKKFFENMWKTLTLNEVWEGELKNLDKNGNSYWERGSISPIYDLNKKIIGYRAIKVNITAEKQVQKVNSILKKELFNKINEIKTMDQLKIDESKIRLMSQILDTFSNEWKKPISNMSSSILEFENRVDKARYTKNELKEFINFLRDEVKYLSINLNEFRKLFISSDKNDKYNIYEVVNSILDSIYVPNLTFELKGDKNIQTYGNSYDLRKVVLGIITNSLDIFKTKNIKNAKIEINLSKKEDNIFLTIKDNAGGIPKEILPKIFDYNFSTKYYINLQGVPLYLAKLIIEKSNGKLWVENIEEGCCFYIQLKAEDKRSKEREISL